MLTQDRRERRERMRKFGKEGSVVAALGIMAAAIRSSGLAPWRLGGCRLVHHVMDLHVAYFFFPSLSFI
jgi:uncharacterized protein involved in response to NO